MGNAFLGAVHSLTYRHRLERGRDRCDTKEEVTLLLSLRVSLSGVAMEARRST